jgi:mRNA interferase MazF
LINLDATVGREIKETRPCLIIFPDEMNSQIATVIVAPMTRKGHPYPARLAREFQGKEGQIVLDQIRTVDKLRFVRELGQQIHRKLSWRS